MPSVKPRINFVTSEEIYKKLKELAEENDRTLSKEVERACKKYIEACSQ